MSVLFSFSVLSVLRKINNQRTTAAFLLWCTHRVILPTSSNMFFCHSPPFFSYCVLTTNRTETYRASSHFSVNLFVIFILFFIV